MVYKFLTKAKWPKDLPTTEEDFNKNQLKDYIKNILSGTWQLKNRKDYTKVEMGLFGYGCRSNPKHKADFLFSFGEKKYFVENKIIRVGKECNIKNGLVQAVEYLHLYCYKLLGIYLVFDGGRGKGKDWDISTPEYKLIHTITNAYEDMCVVRVRKLEDNGDTINQGYQNVNNKNCKLVLLPSKVEVFYQNAYIYRENR